MKLSITFFSCFWIGLNLSAQPCPEPDASIWEKAWYTCEQSQNPNPEHGRSYWIQYDFGRVRTLSKSWIWNVNDPAYLSRGFQSVQVDYSVDGREWIRYGLMDFPTGTGDAVYGGFSGPDLTGVEAQYILLTALSNHGDASCFGLTEVKFNLLPNVEGDKADQDDWCTSGFSEVVVEEVGEEEAYIIWDYPTDDERFQDYFFPVQYRPEGDEVWKGKLAEDLFVFLEELEPGTTYEFRLGTACSEFISYTDVYTFTTEGDADPVCDLVGATEVEELTSTGVQISWAAVSATDGYLVAYQEVDTEDWQTLYTEVPYIELSDLQPETEYELYVAVYCDEEELWNEETPLLFTTVEQGNPLVRIPERLPLQNHVNVYPNPGIGWYAMDLTLPTSGAIQYRITDMLGRQYLADRIREQEVSVQLDLRHLPDGMYFLTLDVKGQPGLTLRLVKISK